MDSATGRAVKATLKQVAFNFLISAVYLLVSWRLVGFTSDQLVLIGIFNVMYFASPVTRKFILGFSIFIVYWIVFNYMKAFPNYEFDPVHIAGLYHEEKSLFGIRFNGMLLTPNEYLRAHATTFLDVAGGIFYLCWIPVPLAFAAYLFFKNRPQFLRFALTFFLVNLIGFVIYYLYPAAPPWYVQYHRFNFIAGTPGNTGGLARFDAYFHAGIFKSIYAKSSNVFAAMPSLHSSYPVIVLYYGIKSKLGWFNIFFGVVMLGIWFTAVYAGHHYVLDVLAGITCAITGIVVFNMLLKKTKFLPRFIEKYLNLIQ